MTNSIAFPAVTLIPNERGVCPKCGGWAGASRCLERKGMPDARFLCGMTRARWYGEGWDKPRGKWAHPDEEWLTIAQLEVWTHMLLPEILGLPLLGAAASILAGHDDELAAFWRREWTRGDTDATFPEWVFEQYISLQLTEGMASKALRVDRLEFRRMLEEHDPRWQVRMEWYEQHDMD